MLGQPPTLCSSGCSWGKTELQVNPRSQDDTHANGSLCQVSLLQLGGCCPVPPRGARGPLAPSKEAHSPGLCLMLALEPHLEETLETSTFLFWI